MLGLSGIRCHVCGMAQENPKYQKTSSGDSMYWSDPRVSQFNSERIDFCGVTHSSEWFIGQIAARQDVTQEDNQSTDPVS